MTYTELKIGDTVDINGHPFKVAMKENVTVDGRNLVRMEFNSVNRPYPEFKEGDPFYWIYDDDDGVIVAHFNPNSDK